MSAPASSAVSRAAAAAAARAAAAASPCSQGLTLVHFSAQPEPFVSLTMHRKYPPNTPYTLSDPPLNTLLDTPYPIKGAYVEQESG